MRKTTIKTYTTKTSECKWILIVIFTRTHFIRYQLSVLQPGYTYSSEGKDILVFRSQTIPVSVTALKRNVSWLSEARLYLQHCSDGFPTECRSSARALAKVVTSPLYSTPEKEGHPLNLFQEIYWEGKIQKFGCLCWGGKGQLPTEQV